MISVFRQDCTEDPDIPGNYFSCGATRIVDAPCGRYRETLPEPLMRFGYRFPVRSGRPHRLRVRYPDDRRRFMTIGDGTSYDISCAVVTGGAWPLSGRMQILDQVFWPRFDDMSVCFMAWGYDEPAAAADFEVFELEAGELDALELDDVDGGREFGIQYEDPCGTQASEGATDFAAWREHIFTYMRHTGQNMLAYPLCWYHGPWFPRTSEAAQLFSITVAKDRRQYIAWSEKPEDWVAPLLRDCEKNGVKFIAEFTLLRLGSLMRRMQIDPARIAAGEPTLNNVLCNDVVQSGTMDWTGVYHTGNYPKMLDTPDPLNPGTLGELQFGERYNVRGCPPGPIFNVLRPEVQDALREFFRDTCRAYRGFPAFRGITVTMWAPTLLWFGSLRAGYDDYTIGLFEAENGISIPVDSADAKRFSKRFHWLTEHCRERWIQWRCRKIAAFIRDLRDTMCAERADLRLTITMWVQPYIACVCPMHVPESQITVRKSTDELYREAGIDAELLAGEPNLDFCFQTEGGNCDRSPGNIKDAPPEAFYMFRDHDYLDDSFWNKLRMTERPAVFIFNSWHEAWGRHRWFSMEPDDANAATLNHVYGGRAELFRINSEYAPDGFWWDSQLRIAAATPPAPHYMEHLAHALAAADAVRITAGGLYMDKVHTGEFRAFARVFRRLPGRRFDTVPGGTDPVAVRQLRDGDTLWVYCVNREPYPVEVELHWRRTPSGYALADRAGVTEAPVTLAPYQLAGWRVDGPNEVTGFVSRPPEAVTAVLSRAADDLLASPQLSGAVRREVAAALAGKCWSRLRHWLTACPAAGRWDGLNFDGYTGPEPAPAAGK